MLFVIFSHVAPFAFFKSSLGGLNFTALTSASLTVRMGDKVPSIDKLERNVVLFLRTMLKTLSSPAFECGNTNISLATLNSFLEIPCFSIRTTLDSLARDCNLYDLYRS